MNDKKQVSIIGGGLLGMTLANKLADKGLKVNLYEASPNLGGLAEPWQFGEITWDKYYHVILMSDLYTRDLLKNLGVEDQMNWVETKTGFYTDGQLYSMSNSFEFLKFPPLNLIDKFRLGLTIFAASKIKNWQKLEGQYVSDWLKKWSGKRTFEKMWLPLLRAKLGDSYQDTSAAFIWATIQRMYAARKSGLKKEMFGYINGGYKTIIDSYSKMLSAKGVNICTNHILSSVETDNENIELIFNKNTSIQTDEVFFTIPSSLITKLWAKMPEVELKAHNSIKYLGVSCTSMLLKKDISPYYVTNITDHNVPFTGIIEMSALVDKKEFNDKALVYLPKYIESDNSFFEKTDEEIHKIFKDYILSMYPELSDSDILDMKTAKARNVFALNTLNYSTKLPNIKSSIKGVYYANSAFITNGTLNVNETIALAEKILKDY